MTRKLINLHRIFSHSHIFYNLDFVIKMIILLIITKKIKVYYCIWNKQRAWLAGCKNKKLIFAEKDWLKHLTFYCQNACIHVCVCLSVYRGLLFTTSSY